MTCYAVVEHSDLLSGKKLSASGKRKNSRHCMICSEEFEYEHEFGRALMRAVEALHAKELDAAPKLLVISAHGKPRTGTDLEAAGDGQINLWEFRDYFSVLPPNMVIYVSACFGGYPAVAHIQSDKRHTPFIVGPLVDIEIQDANAFQEALLDLMDNGSISRSGLYRLVRRFNKARHRAHRYGRREWLFGMYDTHGFFFPRRSIGAQLAAPVEPKTLFRIVEVVRGDAGHIVGAILADDRGVRRRAIIEDVIDVSDSIEGLIGKRITASYQVTHTSEELKTFGARDDGILEWIHLLLN
jgi:hypothetical protein